MSLIPLSAWAQGYPGIGPGDISKSDGEKMRECSDMMLDPLTDIVAGVPDKSNPGSDNKKDGHICD